MKLKAGLKERLKLKQALKYDHFQTVLERFGIGSVFFDAEAENSLLFRSAGSRLTAASGKVGEGRLIITGRECLPPGYDHALTVPDVYALLEASDDRMSEYPLILNTLENCYRAITVAGSSPYAKLVYAYYRENPRITVRQIPLPETDGSGCYRLPFDRTEDELVFFCDLCPRLSVRYESGEEAVSLFVKLLYRDSTDCISYMTDIYGRIIPKLESRGVPVLGVFMPDPAKLGRRLPLKLSTHAWRLLRKLSPDRFYALRNKKRHTEYLAENQKQLTNDVTRGYSVMYGNGPYINFDNGFRRTVGNRNDVARSVAVFGPCFIRSLGTEDKETIPSLIQQSIPGYNLVNRGSEFGTCNLIMRGREFHKGDAVVIFFQQLEKDPRPAALKHTLDLTGAFRSVDRLDRHVFDDVGHYDLKVQKAVAEATAAALGDLLPQTAPAECGAPVFFGPETHRVPAIRTFSEDPGLKEWAASVEAAYPYHGQKRCALVMNCNPFTLGHRYLVDTAAAQSEELFLFVVQEDRSFFPFEDRFRMVKEGVKDLKNVRVLPSGNYIVSSQTLPGYFRREDLSSSIRDSGTDLDLFIQIADALHIERRFVGTEPTDVFTNNYNLSMNRILPRNGIAFTEIERKQAQNGKAISATTVRAAIRSGDRETVRSLVPPTTYAVLEEKGYFDRA